MKRKYRLSFSVGGLLLAEAGVAVSNWLETRDWQQTRQNLRTENLLQARTASSATRVAGEVCSRLETLTTAELEVFSELNSPDQALLMWLAACRRYELLAEFATEVVRKYYLTLRHCLEQADFDVFYGEKAVWHEELEQITESTRNRLRANTFLMLRQAHLLDDDGNIQMALPGPLLLGMLAQERPEDLLRLPLAEHEVQRWLK